MSTVHLAGSPLHEPRHVCAFFNSNEHPDRIFLPYMREGVEQGDRVVDIVASNVVSERERELAAAGVGGPSANRRAERRERTPLDVQGWDESYLKDGYFDVERQLSLVESMMVETKSLGFRLTRFVASMEWALEPRPGVENIVEYEARLNMLMTRHDDAAICSYDLARYNAPLIIDILRAHPVVLLGGRLYLNPFFVAPNRLLAELRERRITAH